MPFQGIVGEIRDLYENVQFDWEIKNFFSLNHDVDSRYHSPDFDFWGCESFYLRLYPNGEINCKSEGWIGLYLVLNDDCVEDVSFNVGIKTADGNMKQVFTFTRTFEKTYKVWGFSQFLKRSVLKNQRRKLMPSGVLTIAVTMYKGDLEVYGRTTDTSVQTDVKEITYWDKYIQCQFPEKTGSSDVSVQAAVEEIGYSEVKEKYTFTENTGSSDASVQTNAEELGSVEMKEAYSFSENTGGEKVLQDIIKMWRNGDICDVIIEVKGVEFKAHKFILAARTPVLAAMFQHDTTEKKSGIIIIKDCEPTTFEIFLNYIYTGNPQKLTPEKAISLYIVAEKYLVDDLKAFCLQYIQDNLCLDIFCDAVMLAILHGETKLLDCITCFAAQNIRQIIKTVKWQNFIKEESEIANEILIKALE